MANTYTQIHIQVVFVVKHRQNLIKESFRVPTEKYICGIVKQKKCKPLAIYCNPDHTHLLLGLHPTVALSDLVRDIKTNSTKYINKNKWVLGRFEWQVGFGAFSYAKSQLNRVIRYIDNQPIHHQKKTFREEYLAMLKKSSIDYDNNYLFDYFE